MFAAVGNHVVGLHRERIGAIPSTTIWRRENTAH
jgi:16S rRNA U516 pseudouridylate synthase RsuA-like enzyme